MLLRFCVLITVLLCAVGEVYASTPTLQRRADTIKVSTNSNTKISDTRKEKPVFLRNKLKLNFAPFKPQVLKVNKQAHPATTSHKPIQSEEKVLTDVKIYPNPVGEHLNLNYSVSKEVNMTIKVMDFLGNEVTTLLSQRVRVGEQTNTFNIRAKLNSGMYFIRFIAGNETIVKRISVL